MYVLIYLVKGSLPWQGFKVMSRMDKQTQIMDQKMSIPESMLCENLPSNNTSNLKLLNRMLLRCACLC